MGERWMKHIIGEQKVVSFSETSSGDLVLFSEGNGSSIGIVLQFDRAGDPLLGVLQSDFDMPTLRRQDKQQLCVSFGADWAFEPLEPLLAAPNYVEVNRRVGLLALGKEGWLMNFATSMPDGLGRFKWEWWNLETYNVLNKEPSRSAVYTLWEVWAPVSHRERLNAEPLVKYQARPTQQR
jgi:hypothetical protein